MFLCKHIRIYCINQINLNYDLCTCYPYSRVDNHNNMLLRLAASYVAEVDQDTLILHYQSGLHGEPQFLERLQAAIMAGRVNGTTMELQQVLELALALEADEQLRKGAKDKKKVGSLVKAAEAISLEEETEVSGQVKKSKAQRMCHNCGEKGHYKYECPVATKQSKAELSGRVRKVKEAEPKLEEANDKEEVGKVREIQADSASESECSDEDWLQNMLSSDDEA